MDIYQQEYEREQREAARRHQETLAAQDFEAVARLPEGRRLLHRFLRECGVYRTTFTGDALTSAHNEGRRAMGLWLIQQFNDCQYLYIKLLTEQDHGNSGIND